MQRQRLPQRAPDQPLGQREDDADPARLRPEHRRADARRVRVTASASNVMLGGTKENDTASSAPIGRPLIGEDCIHQRIPPLAPDERILPKMALQAKSDARKESL